MILHITHIIEFSCEKRPGFFIHSLYEAKAETDQNSLILHFYLIKHFFRNH